MTKDFIELVLFQLIDVSIPDWVEWIAIDKDGEIFGYDGHPEVEGPHDEDVWMPGARCSKCRRFNRSVDIPKNLDWRDAAFTL